MRVFPPTRAYRLPTPRPAETATGRRVTANIVRLGLLVGLTDVVSRKAIEAAVKARAPKGTEKLNLAALTAGLEEAARLKGD